MQKHNTAVGSKLLWHIKWYIIHVWRHIWYTSKCYWQLSKKLFFWKR